MEKVIGVILEHPIASCIVIGTTTSGIADIITAIRGREIKPKIHISLDKRDK